jgi:hypothetical protein
VDTGEQPIGLLLTRLADTIERPAPHELSVAVRVVSRPVSYASSASSSRSDAPA